MGEGEGAYRLDVPVLGKCRFFPKQQQIGNRRLRLTEGEMLRPQEKKISERLRN